MPSRDRQAPRWLAHAGSDASVTVQGESASCGRLSSVGRAAAWSAGRVSAAAVELDYGDGCYACQRAAPERPAPLGPRRRIQLMEKFVIEGGVPLSGTMVPAGNKNGALPILASCLLTEDEIIVRNVPRIRDVDAMLDILRAVGVAGQLARAQRGRAVRRRRARGRGRRRARRADPRLVPARRAPARALRPRRDAAAGRRRDRPPPPRPAPRRLPRDGRRPSNATARSSSPRRAACVPPTSSWTSPQ